VARIEKAGLYDWAAAAEYLGTNERHVQRLWAERKLAGSKIGKKVRFSQRDLDAFIERNRVEAKR